MEGLLAVHGAWGRVRVWGFRLPLRIQERLHEHPLEREVFGFGEFDNAKPDAIVAGGRLVHVGAKQAIPPGESIREVRLPLPQILRMVDAMHVGRHEHYPEDTVQQHRDSNVGVLDKRQCDRQKLGHQDCDRRRVVARIANFQHGSNLRGLPVRVGDARLELVSAGRRWNLLCSSLGVERQRLAVDE